MKVKHVIAAGLMVLVLSCNNSATSEFTTVKVKEVEQVGGYTYLLVKGKGPEYWVAVSAMEATPGETYYYQGGLLMEDFHSNELDRDFESVLFVDAIYPGTPPDTDTEKAPEMMDFDQPLPAQGQGDTPGSRTVEERAVIEVEAEEGTVTIKELYANPAQYEGKQVKVTGMVTKFNPQIMDRNWVHLQDGSEYEGKFDLTATSSEYFETGNTVTLEGVLALNRDFGYGYNYELLLENATAVGQ
ncbi:MAG: GW dipeptide domain-containing protein [Bacteroidales bacterium]